MTDAEALDIVRMVLVGKTNRELVGGDQRAGAGRDRRRRRGRPAAGGRAGRSSGWALSAGSPRSAAGCSTHFHDDGLIPIVSTVGADATGQPYNVNADDAARAIAVAMKAEKIIYLTGAPGLLEDPADPASLVHRLTAAEARAPDRRRRASPAA